MQEVTKSDEIQNTRKQIISQVINNVAEGGVTIKCL